MATFYLKYRPQTIDQLDLDSVRLQLTKVLESKSIPHAFLFSGPRGLGKTSAARILAKAINCERKQVSSIKYQESSEKKQKNASLPDSKFQILNSNIEPCNQCDACISITKGSAIDVIEIDGASNRGIDDVRALREGVACAPLQLKKKVYVIDEVHMLTKEAFNALLKTLEEPPEHVVFILATTEPGKIPDTIISRAFHLQFHRASDDELKRSLGRVVEGEHLTVTDGVLRKIISRSQGGFRDSVKMLEQLSMNNPSIDEAAFDKIFADVDTKEILKLLAEKNCQAAFTWITLAQEQGADWEQVCRSILEKLRVELLAGFGMGTKEYDALKLPQIHELIKLFTQAANQLKTSLVPTLPMELLVAQWCEGNTVTVTKNQVPSDRPQEPSNKNQVTDGKQNDVIREKEHGILEKSNKEPEQKEMTGGIQTGNNIHEEKQQFSNTTIQQSSPDLIVSHDDSNPRYSGPGTSLPPLDQIKSRWEDLLKAVKPSNHSIEGLLRSAYLDSIEGNTLIIKVYYAFHKGQLEKDKCLQIVEQAFMNVLGVRPKIQYILGKKEEKQKLESQKDSEFAKMAEEILVN